MLLSLLPIDDGDVMMRITYFRLLSSKKVKWFFARFLCEFFLSDEEEKCIKYEHSILKYPREATPIPGPHLGRSELFNRSVSATTNERSPLLRRLFSLFSSSSSSVYSSRYSQSSRREKSSFFGAKIFLQSDLSSKKAAKREEFSVTFHKTTNSKRADIITSSHFYSCFISID